MIIFHPSIFQLKWALNEKLLIASPADVDIEEDIDDALNITDDSLAFIRHLYQTPSSRGHREAVQEATDAVQDSQQEKEEGQ